MQSDVIFDGPRNGAHAVSILLDPDFDNVILIGPKGQFPDCLCRVILSEIEGSRLLRLGSLADLASAVADGRVRPRLVIVDDSLWDTMDENLLAQLRQDCGAIVAIAFRTVARVQQITAQHPLNGQVSYLPMDLNIQSWLTILRLLLTGYPFVPSELAKGPAQAAPQHTADVSPAPARPAPTDPNAPSVPRAASLPPRLTPRENEVLRLLARGLQNKHIAERLTLSEHTVKLHVHKVISKLGATNRTDAAMRYHHLNGA